MNLCCASLVDDRLRMIVAFASVVDGLNTVFASLILERIDGHS